MNPEITHQQGRVRPAIKRGQIYDQEETSKRKKEGRKYSPLSKIHRSRSWVDVKELATFALGSGFPGFAPRDEDHESRNWSYHLIRHIHHRQSPIGSHLRPLTLIDQRIITRGIAEQLKRALEQLVAHERCGGKDCECHYRPRSETEQKGVYVDDSDEDEDVESAVYISIGDAVRAKIDKTPEILVRAKEAAIEAAMHEAALEPDISLVSVENELSTPILSDSQSPTSSQPETPAWIMSPSISWPLLESALEEGAISETPDGEVEKILQSPMKEVAQRPRARTIDSAVESGLIKIREAQQKKKVVKETDGIRALKMLQLRYAKENKEWIVPGGFDDPVQVWVEEWSNTHPGILKKAEPIVDETDVGEVVDMGKITESLEEATAGLSVPAMPAEVAVDNGRERSSSNVDFLTDESRSVAGVLLTD